MSDDNATTEPTRQELLTVLAGLYDFADIEIPPQWPVGSEHVVDLLNRCGYRLSNGDLLAWSKQLLIPMTNGRRLFGPQHIIDVMGRCEALRRWQPNHPAHAHKLTNLERLQAEAEAAGKDSVFPDLDRFDVETLLHFIEEAETRALRHALKVAITCKLKAGESL